MRHDAVPAEQKLWHFLRNRQLCGLKFRRQVPISNYIADFYCASAGVILEIDGASHIGRERYDDLRTEWLEGRSYRIIRFGNADVYENIEGVLIAVAASCGK
jgi:very-short-patch-repair endonuclease